MAWWQALILGALQGVTEFLPISSSGHLVIFQHFFHFEEGHNAQAIFFDGILHLGTMVAVLLYFRRDLQQLAQQWRSRSKASINTAGATTQQAASALWPGSIKDFCWLGVLLGLATLPAAVLSLWKAEHIQNSFNRPWPVTINFLILSAVLLLTDWLSPGKTTGATMRGWQALTIGLAQGASAIFRGLSRSGMTISMSLLVGLERTWAVRFSFMMSVVASGGLGLLGILRALKDPQRQEWLNPEFLGLTVLGVVTSGVVGYLTIDPLISFVRKARLRWFALYLMVVSLIVMVYI